MRRRTEGVLIGGEAVTNLPYDDDTIIDALARFATPARIERIRKVLDARIDAVTVVVDALHDPHNGAAIIRSCDAFGVQTLHAVERAEAIAVAPTISRGAQKWIDLVRYKSGAACVEALRRGGWEPVATHPEGELVPADLARIERVAVVLGNERSGIGEDLRAVCARSVRVPMIGFVESLNVSVTAAILLHAATTGRTGDLTEARKHALFARALWKTIPRPEEHVAAHLQRFGRGDGDGGANR